MNCIRIVLAITVVFYGVGCNRSNDGQMVWHQDQIVAKALQEVPLLKDFQRLFPESQHFITYITGKDGPPTWNSKTPLFQRYVFDMQVPIEIDRNTFKVRLTGQPSFYFREVTVITTLPGGRQDVHYGESIPFDLTGWKKLVTVGGDFQSLGIRLKRDQPIVGFSDYSKY
jgi:hypothetical protein